MEWNSVGSIESTDPVTAVPKVWPEVRTDIRSEFNKCYPPLSSSSHPSRNPLHCPFLQGFCFDLCISLNAYILLLSSALCRRRCCGASACYVLPPKSVHRARRTPIFAFDSTGYTPVSSHHSQTGSFILFLFQDIQRKYTMPSFDYRQTVDSGTSCSVSVVHSSPSGPLGRASSSVLTACLEQLILRENVLSPSRSKEVDTALLVTPSKETFYSTCLR